MDEQPVSLVIGTQNDGSDNWRGYVSVNGNQVYVTPSTYETALAAYNAADLRLYAVLQHLFSDAP